MQVKQTQHKVSQFLVDRHPYIEEVKSDKLEVCVALGRRGVGKLADILRDPTQTDAEVGAGLELLLKQLTTQEKKIEAIRAGVVQASTAIMGGDGYSAATRASAGRVLGSLAQVFQGRSEIAKAKTIPVLTSSCLDPDSAVRTAASTALFHTSSFRDGWAMVIDTPRAVKNLVKSLNDHPASISVFANLTSFFDEGAIQCLKFGVMPELVKVMRESTDVTLRKHSVMTLRNIVNNDSGKEKAIRYGGVDAAAGMLTDNDAQVRATAAGAIQTMCVNQEAKPLFLDVRTGVKDMASLLRDESADVRDNATLAIRNLSELPDAKSAFVAALVGDLDLLESVYGASCAGPLCELLESKEAETRGHAARAFQQFTRSKEDQLLVVNALHVVPRLTKILTDDQPSDVKRAAATALQALCTSYADAAKRLRKLVRAEGAEELRRALMSFQNLRAIALQDS